MMFTCLLAHGMPKPNPLPRATQNSPFLFEHVAIAFCCNKLDITFTRLEPLKPLDFSWRPRG